MLIMFDSADPNGIPAYARYVAGYVDGGDFPQLVARFPHAQHLSIATNAGLVADCLDVERGDATPDQALGWVQRMQRQGVYRPCVYASIDNYMPQVIGALQRLPRE